MVKIESIDEGFYLIGVLGNNVSLSDLVYHLCSKVDGIDYIGKRITKKERENVTLIKYDDKLYYEKTCSGYDKKYRVKFIRFHGKLEDTESAE